MFTAGGCSFQLEVYPSGASADVQNSLSVFLSSPSGCASNHLLYEIAILDQSGKGRHLVRACNSKQVREDGSSGGGEGMGVTPFAAAAVMVAAVWFLCRSTLHQCIIDQVSTGAVWRTMQLVAQLCGSQRWVGMHTNTRAP